eukprot:9797721-Karenia_brevis.AAC.1
MGETLDLVKDFGLKTFLTNTDPECSNATGGVGILFKSSLRVIKLQAATQGFADVQSNGRVQLLGIVLPSNALLI